jgi:hypothetical protein
MADAGEDFALEDHLGPEERDPETPQEDAVEQATVVDPADRDPEVRRGLEVDEWDSLEQARVVDLDDEYR